MHEACEPPDLTARREARANYTSPDLDKTLDGLDTLLRTLPGYPDVEPLGDGASRAVGSKELLDLPQHNPR